MSVLECMYGSVGEANGRSEASFHLKQICPDAYLAFSHPQVVRLTEESAKLKARTLEAANRYSSGIKGRGPEGDMHQWHLSWR